MYRFNNLPEQKEHRKVLRKKMTPQEAILWAKLRRNGLGVKFRRQHSLGRYIADFYCTERKFVIELDGGQHFEQKEYDEERTKYFRSLGICVVRVWNDEIYKNLSGVMLKIEEVLREGIG